MTDIPPTAPEEQEPYYTETVVEYVDNRRQRIILGTILVVLFLLLIAASYAVVKLTPGAGAPSEGTALPEGIKWVRSIYGWGNGAEQTLLAPTDVAIAKDGTIWVLSAHDTIAGFNPDGSAKRILRPEGVVSLEGLAIGENGNIYVADYGGQLLEFTPDGKRADMWKVQLPSEVDVRDGKIAVASGPGVAVFTPEGKMLVQVGTRRGWGADQFDLPHGIVQGPEGNIYVSDTQNRRIKALSPTGRTLWMLGDAPDRSKEGAGDVRSQDSSSASAPFLLPSGMTMDGKGRLVVVDPFKFRIAIVDAKTGKVVQEKRADGSPGRNAFYGDYGQQDGMFAYPTGISYDKSRDWFAVADTANNRVQIIRLPDTGGSVTASLTGGFRWPMLVCCIPWIVLLIAVIVQFVRRRRQRDATAEMAPGVEN